MDSPANSSLTEHYSEIADLLLRGRVVPFLGAGVNLCDRPDGVGFGADQSDYLPSGAELARYLADQFRYPAPTLCANAHCPVVPECEAIPCGRTSPELDLSRVSQYAVTHRGPGALYEELQAVFAREYPLTSAHRFIARLCFEAPHALKKRDSHPLIVTTNYDDLMERALGDKPFDLVYYNTANDAAGQFSHRPPGRQPILIEREKANDYAYPFLEERPAILKMHGTIDSTSELAQGVVITEDNYIDYLASETLDKLLPPRLLNKLRGNYLLFLGYSLRDWNLRVFLRKAKRTLSQDFICWAIIRNASNDDRRYLWDAARVEVLTMGLAEYLKGLSAQLKRRDGVPVDLDAW